MSSPLLFAGQYEDAESGWVYNRFRFYDPFAGVYGAQDPLGVAPRVASAQGYVDHAGIPVDRLGLKACDPDLYRVDPNDLTNVAPGDRQNVADYLNHEGVYQGSSDPASVYHYDYDKHTEYVGITNDLAQREAEHSRSGVLQGKMEAYTIRDTNGEVHNLTRHQARAIEQHGIGNLENKINSIAPGRIDVRGGSSIPVYSGSQAWANTLTIE